MALAIFLFACKKNGLTIQPNSNSYNISNGTNLLAGTASVVTTYFAREIAYTKAVAGGNISGQNIKESGVCWSTNTNPTIANFHVVNSSGALSFSCSMTGLTANTTYYVRAYIIAKNVATYGNEIAFTTLTTPVYGIDTDMDGNTFRTIKIGAQTWMLDNLQTVHYLDGTSILNVTDNAAWSALTTGAYCNYNNDVANVATFGRLYNFSAATDAVHILAPNASWHIPNQAEWDQLEHYLGGTISDVGVDTVIGRKLKEAGTVHWAAPNPADNLSGFTALPAGYRRWDGCFIVKDSCVIFWSSSLSSVSGYPYGRFMNWKSDWVSWAVLTESGDGGKRGASIRCIKN